MLGIGADVRDEANVLQSLLQIDRYLRPAPNHQLYIAAADRQDRQTDRRTPYRYIDAHR